MKIPISAGLWLVYVGCTYLVLGMANIHYKWCDSSIAQAIYVLVLALPLFVPPIGRWVGLKPFWSKE